MIPLAVSTAEIILLVVILIVGGLAAGGGAANRRRARAGAGRLLAQLEEAERGLAQARAGDKGWDPAVMEAAARGAVAERLGDPVIAVLQLVQVIDHPGTDADVAVFRVETADGSEHHVTLGRTGGVWGAAP